MNYDKIADEFMARAKRERVACRICMSEDIAEVRFDARAGGWEFRGYCKTCAERMHKHEIELASEAERERARARGNVVVSIMGDRNACASCRYYAYLTTLGVHLCHGPGAGEMSEQEVRNVSIYGCDAYEPREGSA